MLLGSQGPSHPRFCKDGPEDCQLSVVEASRYDYYQWEVSHFCFQMPPYMGDHMQDIRGMAMAPHSSTLAWKIPWTEEPVRLQSVGSLRVGHDWATWLHFHFSLSCIGEGKGNPLQCSCLENPRDGGAWWAAVYGVAQSRTWLKWLSIALEKKEVLQHIKCYRLE